MFYIIDTVAEQCTILSYSSLSEGIECVYKCVVPDILVPKKLLISGANLKTLENNLQ